MSSVFTYFKKRQYIYIYKLCISVRSTLNSWILGQVLDMWQDLGIFFASPGPAGFLASRRALLSPKLHSFAAVRALDVSKNCLDVSKKCLEFVYQEKS